MLATDARSVRSLSSFAISLTTTPTMPDAPRLTRCVSHRAAMQRQALGYMIQHAGYASPLAPRASRGHSHSSAVDDAASHHACARGRHGRRLTRSPPAAYRRRRLAPTLSPRVHMSLRRLTRTWARASSAAEARRADASRCMLRAGLGRRRRCSRSGGGRSALTRSSQPHGPSGKPEHAHRKNRPTCAPAIA